MLYQNYEDKIRRVYKVRRVIYRNRVLIFIITAILSLLLIAFMTTKGVVYDVSYNDQLVYGDDFKVSSKSIFSSTRYEYKKNDAKDWTKDRPTDVGLYEIKIISIKVFKKNKEII